MNYLSNSTGIYIRLRQHPLLKSSPHLPRIPKEALTEVKFLYVNTGNAESPTCSAIASALTALVCAGEQTGLLCSHFATCQCPQRSVCFPSPAFSHSWMHCRTMADKAEDRYFKTFSSTFIPSCLVHTYPGFPTFICSSKGWILPIPLLDNLREHLSWVCHPFCGSQQAVSRANPSSPRAKAHQAVSTGGRGTAGTPKAAFPLLQVSRTKGRTEPGQSWVLHQHFPDLTHPWEQLSMSSHLCLLCSRLANPTTGRNKDGDLFVEAWKELKCPKTELKMPLHRLSSHSSPEEAFEGTSHAHPRAPAPLEWLTPQGELSRA